ncbi:MAG TPA: hypothetical protein VMU39_28985 [Solirubrobacteraceae bacterium]|nr:hypothetical protein [Solirubrobacteraceae bacterium]
MAQRSRKRGRRSRSSPATGSAVEPAPGPAPARRLTADERNAAVRASLVPLAPGERPWPVLVSVVVASLLGGVNLVMYLLGTKLHVGGQQPHLPAILVFSGLMLMCAIGMWRMRYWALLGFQTLLAIGVLGFCLALVKASTIVGALICVVVIGAGGFLFYKLVRVLSRVQMPAPPGQ